MLIDLINKIFDVNTFSALARAKIMAIAKNIPMKEPLEDDSVIIEIG